MKLTLEQKNIIRKDLVKHMLENDNDTTKLQLNLNQLKAIKFVSTSTVIEFVNFMKWLLEGMSLEYLSNEEVINKYEEWGK